MPSDILRLVFVLLSLPAGALKHKGGSNASWGRKPDLCAKVTVLAQLFSCFKADNIPVFARHGLLLGAVREKSLLRFDMGDGMADVDDDFDVGYLPENKRAVFEYLSSTSLCLSQNNTWISSFQYRPPYKLRSCKAPSVKMQEAMIAGAPLTYGLKHDLESLCTEDSLMSGFGLKVIGSNAGIELSGSEFQRDGDTVFYETACVQFWNCAKEVHHRFAKYDRQLVNPGTTLRQPIPGRAFQSLKAVPFVLSRNYTFDMMVPYDAEAVLKGLYGPSWNKSYNKKRDPLIEMIRTHGPQTYICPGEQIVRRH